MGKVLVVRVKAKGVDLRDEVGKGGKGGESRYGIGVDRYRKGGRGG